MEPSGARMRDRWRNPGIFIVEGPAPDFASAFALRASADKSLHPGYKTMESLRASHEHRCAATP
jgi:hypothetical protein